MEELEEVACSDDGIDDFYVVDTWNDKQDPDINDNPSHGEDIDVSSATKDGISRRKPTEGEIDEFLENIKGLNSKCGTSGLEDDDNNSFKSTQSSNSIIGIPEGSIKDTFCPVINQEEIHFSDKQFIITNTNTGSVHRSISSTVSYKPGGTLAKTFFTESSSSFNNNQDIGISSSDALFNVSCNQNEDSEGGFSDVKASNRSNESCESAIRTKPSHQPRRLRSRSPNRNAQNSSIRDRQDSEAKKIPSWEQSRHIPKMDFSRTDRNSTRDRRRFDDVRRQRRSRSRSRERRRRRSRSPGRSYRPLSLSPSPTKRDEGNKAIMQPPLYQNSGYRDGYGAQGSLPANPSFMNPNVRMPLTPVQYPVNPMSSAGPYGRYPGYEQPPMFNSGPPQPHNFQPQMTQNFSYPPSQNYQGFNPMGVQVNPPNPVPFPSSWNQSTPAYNQNFTNSDISTTAVMYPHLKIGQPRLDSFNRNESPSGSSPQNKHSKSSSEKRKYSRSKSPDSRKHKKKLSKRHSKSPTSNHKYDDRGMNYEKHSKSPFSHKFESKNPKVIIDPNRIPTPPPPPIVGSYDKESPRNEKAKAPYSRSGDSNSFSDFLSKDKVSLSCLLEAVMENSGQGKSQLSDPKVKRDIISKCESKIRHLYKRRMSGLGAFIPDPVQPTPVIEHVSPLIASCSHFTYNCEEESSVWNCPGIIVPKIKLKKKKSFEKALISDFGGNSRFGTKNPTVIPTLKINETKQNFNSSIHHHPQVFKGTNESNNQNMYQAPQNWYNPVPQNTYTAVPPVPNHGSEIPTLGPPCQPPMYYQPSSAGNFVQPQQGYPAHPEMLTYPTRVGNSPLMPIPPKYHDVYNAPQNNQIRNDYNHFKEEANKSKKSNKKAVNNNLILLVNNPKGRLGSEDKTTCKNEKIGDRIDLTEENDLKKDNIENIKSDDENKTLKGLNEAKDKLLRKLWQLRKSTDYVPAAEQQSIKEQDDDIYNNLNYAEMNELDIVHDYQLTNLRERIETCLAKGKVSPEHSMKKNRERREDRERDRHHERVKSRDRERERAREKERSRRDVIDDDRKRHGKSPLGNDRKKYRPGEVPPHDREYGRMRSRESPTQLINKSDDVIEILSDEDHKKQIEKEEEPAEKTLTTQIFDLLGPEIRKIQEKSELYKSIIASLDLGDRSYKRLYSFKNTALTKADKDNKMKMVVPRDNLKEIVVAIHKNFHHVQSEELSRLLRDLIYPTMIHISKCISKVMSECPVCIEQKKIEDEKKEEPKKDIPKDKKIEKKPEKRIDTSIKSRDRERDRRNSDDRDRRFSKGRSTSSSRGVRRDPPRTGREREVKDKDSSKNDGRPSGYEKAIKVKKPAPATPKSDKEETSVKSIEDKSEASLEEIAPVDVLHELSDKALEFKQCSESNIEESKEVLETENSNRQITSEDSDKSDANALLFADELSKNDSKSQSEVEKESSSAEAKNEDNNKNTVCDISKSLSDSSVVNTIKENVNPPDNFLNTVTEENEKCNVPREQVKENFSITEEIEKSNVPSEQDKKNFNKAEENKKSYVPSEQDKENFNKTEENEKSNVPSEQVKENFNKTEENEKSNVPSEQDKENFNKTEENEKPNVPIEQDKENFNKTEENEKSNVPSEQVNENINKEEDKISTNTKTDIVSKEVEKSSAETTPNVIAIKKAVGPKLDFKGRVRQVQLSSNECRDVISALESGGDDKSVDPSYLMKGGMLCKKTTIGSVTEIKIVAPKDQLEEVANIVHTMSVIHTSPPKVVVFFSKHFTHIDDLDSKVNEFINKCSICKIKSS